MLNAIRWCSGKEKPRIGIKGAKVAPVLEASGLRSANLDRADKRKLHEFDVDAGFGSFRVELRKYTSQ